MAGSNKPIEKGIGSKVDHVGIGALRLYRREVFPRAGCLVPVIHHDRKTDSLFPAARSLNAVSSGPARVISVDCQGDAVMFQEPGFGIVVM